MLSGKFRGSDLGSGTGVWQMTEKIRSGEMKREEFFEAESCMHRSKGHCMTMGTASTMASMVEALGMSLPGNAAIPAVDARRNTLAQMTGRRIVQMVRGGFAHFADSHARSVRECDPDQCRYRRIDQCSHPPDRSRRAHRRAAMPAMTSTDSAMGCPAWLTFSHPAHT